MLGGGPKSNSQKAPFFFSTPIVCVIIDPRNEFFSKPRALLQNSTQKHSIDNQPPFVTEDEEVYKATPVHEIMKQIIHLIINQRLRFLADAISYPPWPPD
jgi:hypothetical protein